MLKGLSYTTMHVRANAVLPRICVRADSTCRGRLNAALRDDAPLEWLVVADINAGNRTRYDAIWFLDVELPIEAGYEVLCEKHHNQADGRYLLGAAATRDLMAAARPDFARPGTWAGYQYVHKLARALNLDRPCIEPGPHSARIFQSLKLDTPPDRLFNVADYIERDRAPKLRVYSEDPADYDPLCQSHATLRDLGRA